MAESCATSEECPICLTKIRTKGIIECMHVFCVSCIKEWRGSKQTQNCPICKHPFKDILQIKQNGTSQVLQPKMRQTTRARMYSRPNISQTGSDLYENIDSDLSQMRVLLANESLLETASHLSVLNSRLLSIRDRLYARDNVVTPNEPQIGTNTLIRTGTNSHIGTETNTEMDQSIYMELCQSDSGENSNSQMPHSNSTPNLHQIGTNTLTGTGTSSVPSEEFFALFFCSCGNSWESVKNSFIDEPQNCPICKKSVIPDY